VSVWKAEKDWVWDCVRCHHSGSRSDWRESYRLGREHANTHTGVGFAGTDRRRGD
jgi:hypothetical protein